MRLLLTGIIPAYLLVLLFGGLAVLTVVLYRRHALRKPWSFWLPAVRIVVFALLILALLQPVLARIRTQVVRGEIPILVDTSGSMSLVDTYSPSREVEIAWRMDLFPKKLRNTVFADQGESWVSLSKSLAKAQGSAGELSTRLRRDQRWTKEFGRSVGELADKLYELGDASERLRKAINRSVESTDYLKGKGGDRGRISWRRYDAVEGWQVADLTRNPKFLANKPDFEGTLDRFEIPRNRGDSYGAVIRGYVKPPRDGEYVFFICSDDTSELWLSLDDTPAKKQKIAEVTGFSSYGQWDKFPSQKSAKIKLSAGTLYYVEALYKENKGDDHLIVGWVRPDGKDQRPIPGGCLAPFPVTADPDRFRKEYDRFVTVMDRMGPGLRNGAKSLTDASGAKVKDLETVSSLLEKFQKEAAAYREMDGMLGRIQDLADERLAGAGVDEVRDALDKLGKMKRMDIVKFLLMQKPYQLVEKLKEKGDVEVFSFEENPEVLQPKDYPNLTGKLAATRIGSALASVLKHYEKRPVAGFVLLSDGNNNAGKPTYAVRETLRERGIPVFSLGIGSTVPPPDIAIAQVVAPSTSFIDDRLNISVVLSRHGFTDRPIHLKVTGEGEVLKENVVQPGPEARVIVDMSFIEKKGGLRRYAVETESFDGEAFKTNNSSSFTVNILEDRIRTLLVDEFPRWESRYANMMLKRDRRVDLRTIFVASTKDGSLPAGKTGYPETKQELLGYNILILGDVNPKHFSIQQLADIRDFVVERGGSLITMAGEHYMPSAYAGTPIAELIPLKKLSGTQTPVRKRVPGAEAPDAPGAQPAPPVNAEAAASLKDWLYRLEVPEAARYEDLLQIGGSPDGSQELWQGLPQMNWVREGVSASRAAEILVTAFPERRFGEEGAGRDGFPVMVKAYAGLGKVLYLGSDSFWRWRYKARWTYHHRFWGQILLWATMGRTTGADKYVKLMTDRPIYAPEEVVTIKARIVNDEGTPISEADAVIDVLDENRKAVKSVPLDAIEKSGGEYRAQLRDLARGKYRIVPKVNQLQGKDVKAEVTFEIRDLPTSEYVDLALNETQLRELSDKYYPFEKSLDMVKDVPRIELKETHRDDTEIWDTLPFMLLVALLLAAEWQMRKRNKLV